LLSRKRLSTVTSTLSSLFLFSSSLLVSLQPFSQSQSQTIKVAWETKTKTKNETKQTTNSKAKKRQVPTENNKATRVQVPKSFKHGDEQQYGEADQESGDHWRRYSGIRAGAAVDKSEEQLRSYRLRARSEHQRQRTG